MLYHQFVSAGKVFLNSVEYLDPESMEWTMFVNRCADISRPESGTASRRESEPILPPVNEEEQNEIKRSSNATDSSGCESDEHSS